ncbi:hypothetical protein H5410_040665 [Solanum commersonii]|uniref:Uncharacterized protein n=1 Tax=Solanum commersonii TaxID=4109 RepID=A0A9J5XRJ8_SOLCO|nr:hypothetical protein H5410_040665 [Solanum commersonii]
MANLATGQPILKADRASSSQSPLTQFPPLPNQKTIPLSLDKTNALNYKALLKNKDSNVTMPIEMKIVEFVEGKPWVR